MKLVDRAPERIERHEQIQLPTQNAAALRIVQCSLWDVGESAQGVLTLGVRSMLEVAQRELKKEAQRLQGKLEFPCGKPPLLRVIVEAGLEKIAKTALESPADGVGPTGVSGGGRLRNETKEAPQGLSFLLAPLHRPHGAEVLLQSLPFGAISLSESWRDRARFEIELWQEERG